MKLPNAYGSISKVSGKRRKPYIVRVTVGWTDDGRQIKKSLGYVTTQKEGLKVLADYHNDPYDLDYKNLTFETVWKDVHKELEMLVENKKMSESNLKCLESAFKNHCVPLHKDKILELKYKKMQGIIDNSTLGRTGKGHIKTVCVKVFNCAIDQYELPLKNNPATRLQAGERTESNKHIPFEEEQLEILWKNESNDIVKSLLILCYSGMRPNELFEMPRDTVFIEKDYMQGGSKTEAGKDRLIPIHPRIKPLIKYFLEKSDMKYPFKIIIEDFNYGKYTRRFNDTMETLEMEHTPYDGRHTFVTRMKKAKADSFLLKRIVGHSIQDLTEKVYTHREIEDLINEVKKIT